MTEASIRLIFGLKLRQLRLDQGLSLSEVSKKSDISVSYLNEIEKGKKYPKGSKIATLADALGVEYDYLVSLQLSKRLAPVSELINSNILQELPLDMFGIEIADLIELLSNAPAKLSAFVSTLVEISRNYDMRVEHFYFSVLRSYQEMHENYFPELEEAAAQFRHKFEFAAGKIPVAEDLASILKEHYGYTLDHNQLGETEKLNHLRTVVLPGKNPGLLLNPNLDKQQLAFAYGRELAYNWLEIKNRSYTTSWIEVDSFEQVLNNFKASYFSCALLMPREEFVSDVKDWLQQKSWEPQTLLQLLEKYRATPEMFTHRLTNILPKYFGLHELFFLRFNHPLGSENFYLTKEMHLSGLHNPHANMLNEHYCRRWVSLTIFDDLDKETENGKVICRAQRSKYIGSDNEYLLITLAKPQSPQPGRYSSISLGMMVNNTLKRKLKCWNDASIPVRWVNETCERCPAVDCQERAAPPRILQEENRISEMKYALQELMQANKK